MTLLQGVTPGGDWVVIGERIDRTQPVMFRRIIGVTAPLIGGFVIATLLGRGLLQGGGNLNPLLALLVEVMVGIVGRLLISSLWAVLAVPAAFLAGIALAGLVRTGTSMQGDSSEVASSALFVLIVLVLLRPLARSSGSGSETD